MRRFVSWEGTVKEQEESRRRVDIKDVLLATILRRAREQGQVSPELQAKVDERGREHIERIYEILDIFKAPRSQ